MSVKIEFSTEDATFDSPQAIDWALAEILNRIGEGNEPTGSIYNINGKRIGSYDTTALPEEPEDTSYNGWTNYETWNVKLWMDNEQYNQERWLEAAKNADSKRVLADQMQDEYEEAMPETTGVWADLLSAALGEVNWFEIAEHLIEEVEENQRYEITQMIEAGPTSSGSLLLEDIVAGIEDLLPEKLLDEFEMADEEEQSEIFSEICEYLNEIAPEGVSFSSQEGDGACFGFWKDEEAEQSA